MSDDYLWDGRGPARRGCGARGMLDASARRLRTLRRAPRAGGWRATLPWLTAVAALVVACSGALWMARSSAASSWPVVRLAGVPMAGTVPVDVAARLPVGAWLQTDAGSRASLAISTSAGSTSIPARACGSLESREGTTRRRSSADACTRLIWAPPGQFVVDTPRHGDRSRPRYTLDVRARRHGLIEVSAGWVGFEHGGREAFIPAGARCETRPGVGPGTRYRSARRCARGADGSTSPRRTLARGTTRSRAMLADARPRMRDAVAPARTSAGRGSRRRVRPPGPPRASAGVVTREGIRAGRPRDAGRMVGRAGLGDAEWWRAWKRPWP